MFLIATALSLSRGPSQTTTEDAAAYMCHIIATWAPCSTKSFWLMHTASIHSSLGTSDLRRLSRAWKRFKVAWKVYPLTIMGLVTVASPQQYDRASNCDPSSSSRNLLTSLHSIWVDSWWLGSKRSRRIHLPCDSLSYGYSVIDVVPINWLY
jgi:hypothetical protein